MITLDATINLFSKHYLSLYNEIKDNTHTHYWLSGGRGSGKSSFISLAIVSGLVNDRDSNAVVLRKVAATIRDSTYVQILWAIDKLNLAEDFKATVTPLEITYKPTGQKIIFKGADAPYKIKSIKFLEGYAKYIWYEEADQFKNSAELRSINQSLMRGGDTFSIFYSYNPPPTKRAWINKEADIRAPNKLNFHSTYKDVPKAWLGEPFIIEARHLKQIAPSRYDNEYMGIVTGTGIEVFKNLSLRKITDTEILTFDNIKRGLDFGYASDPLHYTVLHFDTTRRRLYIYGEIQKKAMRLIELAEQINLENKSNSPVYADSAEPRSINELKELGINIRAAKKGPDSVYYGIKFLQDLDEIIIDPERCSQTAREFYSYEYRTAKDGSVLADFAEKDNHSIDAVRYALEAVSIAKGKMYNAKGVW